MSGSRKIEAILWLSLIAVVVVLRICAPSAAKPPKPLQGHRWKVFLDGEFKGNKLDTERWQMYGNPKNRKQQSNFDPKNVTIRGGICVIKAEEVIRRAREAAGNKYLMAGLGLRHKPGLFTGVVEPQFFPATMYIDYIKAWQAVPEQN